MSMIPQATSEYNYSQSAKVSSEGEQKEYIGRGNYGRGNYPQRQIRKENYGREDYPQRQIRREDYGREDYGRGNYPQRQIRREDYGRENYGRGNYPQRQIRRENYGRGNYPQRQIRKENYGRENYGRGNYPQRQIRKENYGRENMYEIQKTQEPKLEYEQRNEIVEIQKTQENEIVEIQETKELKETQKPKSELLYGSSKILIYILGTENLIEKSFLKSHQTNDIEPNVPKNFLYNKDGEIFIETRYPIIDKETGEQALDENYNPLFTPREYIKAHYKFNMDNSELAKKIFKCDFKYELDNKYLFAIFKSNENDRGDVQLIPPNHYFRVDNSGKYIEIRKEEDNTFHRAPIILL